MTHNRAILFSAVIFLVVLFLTVCPTFGGNAGAETDAVQLPIWMYHDVVTEAGETGDYAVYEEQLESDLRALKDAGWQTTSLSDVVAYVNSGKPLPEKAVLLVFDDGYRSVLERVIPLLEKYDMRAVVSIIGARAEGVWDGCDTSGSYMDWGELRQVADSGRVEIQSHSANLHVYRTRKGAQRLPDERDADYARIFSEDILAMDAYARDEEIPLMRSFAYPYGYFEPLAEALLPQYGYWATMTSEAHVNLLTREPSCLLRLGRINRSGTLTTADMLAWTDSLCAQAK